MSSVPSREIERALVKKGFVRAGQKHRKFRLMIGGKQSRIRTELSHTSNMDYNDNLLGLVARQMKLTKKELLQFIECKLGYAEYLQILSERDWE